MTAECADRFDQRTKETAVAAQNDGAEQSQRNAKKIDHESSRKYPRDRSKPGIWV
jgi:hypothetical protein